MDRNDHETNSTQYIWGHFGVRLWEGCPPSLVGKSSLLSDVYVQIGSPKQQAVQLKYYLT